MIFFPIFLDLEHQASIPHRRWEKEKVEKKLNSWHNATRMTDNKNG
jgi:hypothetical protein